MYSGQTHISFLIVLFIISGCLNQSEDTSEVLAKVGNQTLTKAEAKNQIPEYMFVSDSLNAYSSFRDEWIRREIILQEADRINFTNRSEIQLRLQRMREEYILQSIQDYVLADVEADLSVSDQEARNYYQENKNKFTLNERYVRFRHLVAGSYSDAQNARQDLLNGVEWENVAREYSVSPELNLQESDRFWPISVAAGEVEQLNTFLTVIGLNEISPIHREGQQYHFVQLLEERPEGDHPDLDWLIEEIKQWLLLEKRKRAFNSYVKNLYLQGQANNEIQVYDVLNGEQKPASDSIISNTIPNEE